MSRIRAFNRFLEGQRGALLSWIIALMLVTTGGYQLWRDWPRGKPATLLFVSARADGADLIVSFALQKSRECGFTSSRWIENLTTGERWYLATAESSSVGLNDSTVKHIRFLLPPGLPPGAYAFRTKGEYQCPEGRYESDPSFAQFSLPPEPATTER